MESGTEGRPLILEKRSYVPWASQREIVDPKDDTKKILEPIKDIYIEDKDLYCADIKKAVRNHNPLPLVANSYANPSHSYARPSYSRSSPPYFITHPPFVQDYNDDFQREIKGDAQEGKLSTKMMLLARAITQHYSTLTNNRLRTSSNARNQAMIQDGRMDIQSRNARYAGNGNMNVGRTNMNQSTNAGKGLVQKIEENEECSEDSKNCINSEKDKCSVLQLQWTRPLCKILSKT
nr:hypothetical protein [Tanacetum cinerariifolium]